MGILATIKLVLTFMLFEEKIKGFLLDSHYPQDE